MNTLLAQLALRDRIGANSDIVRETLSANPEATVVVEFKRQRSDAEVVNCLQQVRSGPPVQRYHGS